MSPRHSILLQDAELIFLAAFQIDAFSDQHDDELRLARSDRSWLKDLKPAVRKLSADDHLSWPKADLVVSRYYLVNERIGASTLATQQAKGQLPLRIPAASSAWNESGDLFDWRLDSVSIGVGGAACIRHRARLKHPAAVDAVIIGYHILVQDIFRNLVPVAQSLLGGLTQVGGPLDSVEFIVPESGRLDTYIASYECIDIVFTVNDNGGSVVSLPAKRLIENSLDCTRQLAALSRMTRTEPDHLDSSRLQAFKDADIANREDEFWVVNSNRMLRSNPDRHDQHVAYYYEDVVCFVELALQKLAVLEHVNAWLHDARSQFRQQVLSTGKPHDSDIGQILIDFERVLDLIEQPSGLTVGIRHPFFRQIADRLISELRIPTASAQAQSAISMFTQVASAAFTFKVFVSSENTEVTVRRLTWIIMLGTLIGAVIAIVALVLSGT